MEIYRKISTDDRLPKVGESVIVGWNEWPEHTVVGNMSDIGYWWLSGEVCDMDTPDWWLEPVELPSDESAWKVGADYEKLHGTGSDTTAFFDGVFWAKQCVTQ